MARVLPFLKADSDPAASINTEARRRRLGDVLLQSGAIDQTTLEAALDSQRHLDQRLGRILLANRRISDEDLAAALSNQFGLGRIDLTDSPPDIDLLTGVDPYLCLELEAIPWRHVGGTRVIAIANPENASRAMEELGGDAAHVALALASPREIRDAVTSNCTAQLRTDARDRCPEGFSCRTWTAAPKRRLRIGLGLSALAVVAAAPLIALQALMVWILVFNSLTMGLRLVALFARAKVRRSASVGEMPRLADYKKLPRVSILVPLLREEAVAGRLLDALAAMDYPAPLLDIKLVLEEDDAITRAALERAELPPTMDVIMVPTDGLRTKPRAMNYALPFCEGEIVGVYDAEDRPDPDQLRIVVAHLQNAASNVACVQGHLDFYNDRQNWLSRCFTLEYAIWFRVILHGVQRLGIPIPLGGTTVFFRRSVLEEIGAWDAHNVTEDADLGMRLARFGYRCEMIQSTTWEEANCRVRPWIRQRSRWLKGYVVTWATHMQRPAALWRDLGPRGFIGFQVLFLGSITAYLSIPLFWIILASSVGLGLSFWNTFPDLLMGCFIASMVAGQAIMLAIAATAASDTGRKRLLLIVPTLMFYWPLGAVAAYRAIGEVFSRPSYWHKTEHGLDPYQMASGPAGTGAD